MSVEQLNSDNLTQLQYYHERLDLTHRHIQLLKYNIMRFAHKSSKLRDSGDETAQGLLDYSVRDVNLLNENASRLFNLNLKQFAYCLFAVQDHRDCNVECLNSSVLNDLNQLIESVKYSKEKDFKNLLNKYNKDQAKKTSLGSFFNKINKNVKSSCEMEDESVMKKSKSLNEKITKEIDCFERRKIENIQSILKKFTLSQINFHNQALHLYNNAYQCLINQDASYNVKNDIYKSNNDNTLALPNPSITHLIAELNNEVVQKPLILKRNHIMPMRTDSANRQKHTHSSLKRDYNFDSDSSNIFRTSLAADAVLAVAPADRFVQKKLDTVKISNSVSGKTSLQSTRSTNSDKTSIDRNDSKRSGSTLSNKKDYLDTINGDRISWGYQDDPLWFNETRL